MKNQKNSFLIIFFFVIVAAQAQPVFKTVAAQNWADSLLNTLTIEEKLGQLFMVAAYSNMGDAHQQKIEKLIDKEQIGGLIFMQGGPGRQAQLTNQYQQKSKIPLLIGMDAEWDLAMRLDSTFKFPWAMTLGAVSDSSLVYKMGYKMGEHCKRLGVHFSFSPVLDVNTNPENPIINARSFGEDRDRVTQHGLWLMQGMQASGTLACGKHFPGHGDTQTDSHHTLPTIGHDSARLADVELYPYQKLINNGLASVMVAHLNVPALDASGTPASLSKKIVTNELKNRLGFGGLIITDALNMKGVSANYMPGILEVEAFKAGNDILLFSADVPKAKELLLQALANDEITEEQINNRVKKILSAKYFLGLNRTPSIDTQNLHADLNDVESELLRKQIMEAALTVLINKDDVLPVKNLANYNVACVQMGKEVDKTFLQTLNKYTQVDGFVLGSDQNQLLNNLSAYDLVIVGYHTDNKNPWRSYKPTLAQTQFLNKLALQNKFILCLFANPYVLGTFTAAEKANSLIMAYQNNTEANSAAAQLIFGALQAKGTLPVSASKLFDVGYGQQSSLLKRLKFGLPEEQGIDRKKLASIDQLAQKAIAEGATPGCQILIAKNGSVFYQKSFGYYTYSKKNKVTNQTIYDLASITKITATLPLVMKMVDEGALDLDSKLADVYPPAAGTNKANLSLRNILAHQSGLKSWIPFYLSTLTNNQPDAEIYATAKSEKYNLQVSEHLYMNKDYVAEMYQQILESPIGTEQYKYSDLGYYFFKEIIENHYKKPLDVLAAEYFYQPLGAVTTGFNPLKKFNKNQIPPTEKDTYFRFENITGTVHDQGAAMMGGVGGHAGVFSNATDLAKIMQMYLNFGTYGGKRYLDSATVKEFTRCQFCVNNNRRGAGFDKPQLSGSGPTCNCVSLASFGHTGFTGTIAWADPDEKIVYIFLSNRTWPTAENRKLISMNIRSLIQEEIYNAINTYLP